MNILFLDNKYNLYNTEQRFIEKEHYWDVQRYIRELAYLGFEYAFLNPVVLTIESHKNYFRTLPLLRINEFIHNKYNTKEFKIICSSLPLDYYQITNKSYWLHDIIYSLYKEFNPFFTSLHVMCNTKAKASWTQIYQLIGIRGYLSDVNNKKFELPVLNSFIKGLTLFEYFISCLGARKGVVDTAIKTADSGYLTKRLVEVLQEIVIKEYDCGNKNCLSHLRYINIDGGISKSHDLILYGKAIQKNIIDYKTKEVIAFRNSYIYSNTLKLLNAKKIYQINSNSIKLCSVARTVCSKCFMGTTVDNSNLSKSVGVLAGQAIGEPSTQLTLRTFHTGGVSRFKKSTFKKKSKKGNIYSFYLPYLSKYWIISFWKKSQKKKFYSYYNKVFNLNTYKLFCMSFFDLTRLKSNLLFVYSKWIYLRDKVDIISSIYNCRITKLYQRHTMYSDSTLKIDLNPILYIKHIGLLIKNAKRKWVFLNLNKSSFLEENYNYVFTNKLNNFLKTYSFNKKYLNISSLKFKKTLFSNNLLNVSSGFSRLEKYCSVYHVSFFSNKYKLKFILKDSYVLLPLIVFKLSNLFLKSKNIITK